MTPAIGVVVVAAEQARGEAESARLASVLGREVPVFLLRERAERPRPRLLRAVRRRADEGDETDLVAQVRDGGLRLVVATDHRSARAARHAVETVAGVVAVQGADAAARVADAIASGDAIPGGSADDVLGYTRFVAPLDRLSDASSQMATTAHLVIGPDNADGRASEWALLATSPTARGHAVQRVDGADAATASADLTLSSAEADRPGVCARFVDTVTRRATHVLETGVDDLLPGDADWGARVPRFRVLDAVDLMTRDDIARALDDVSATVDDAVQAAWFARVGSVQALLDHTPTRPLVSGAMLGGDLALLPLVHAHPLVPGSPVRAGGEPPLVVTAAPAGQALDPEADRVEALADDGLCRHLSLAGLPPSLWRSAIRAASIVVDRVWLPGLGLAGMLGLEAGRPTVVGPTGLPAGAPVVRTRMAELDQALRDLLVRAPFRVDRGAAFVADQRQHARQVLARLAEART